MSFIWKFLKKYQRFLGPLEWRNQDIGSEHKSLEEATIWR